MVPADPYLVEGSLLTFNCTLWTNTSNSSNMYFKYRKDGEHEWRTVPGKYCSTVNSSTLMMQYQNISRSFDSAQFACSVDNDTFVHQMTISVDGEFTKQIIL